MPEKTTRRGNAKVTEPTTPAEPTKQSPSELFRRHFKPVSKPDVDDKMLTKVSTIGSDELSDLMMKMAAWRTFTEDLMVEALVDYTYKKEKYEFNYDTTLLRQNHKTVKERETVTGTDLVVRELYLSLQESELYYNLLTAKLESYNNCLTVISREITRRTNRDA